MNKFKRAILLLIIGLSIAVSLESCALASDPYFQEGFRQGWNATTPSEYHY